MAKTHTQEDIIQLIQEAATKTSLRQTAVRLGVTVSYLSDVVHGRRSVSEKIAEGMGFERKVLTTIIFRPLKK